MIRQLSLFDEHVERAKFPTCDPTVPQAAKKRLSRQCREILCRLRQGPATNVDLIAIAMNLTGRISDIRATGCVITCYDRNHKTGLCWYRLDFLEEGL